MPAFRDLTGQRFGRLLVSGQAPRHPSGAIVWECACDCGREVVVVGGALTQKKRPTRSCGCLRGHITHGAARIGRLTPEYRAWAEMQSRCANPSRPDYRRYGGRGIRVHPGWRGPGGFSQFVEAVGPKPSPAMTIERIDNEKGYEPGNVRWATRREQTRNRETTRKLRIGHETRPLAEWAELLGLTYTAIRQRISAGWTPARIAAIPLRHTSR